jgi:hypothetical protein
MAKTFLQLVNKVLGAVNEVELTSSNFASVNGFHSQVKDYINQAIIDIYLEENCEWPFSFVTNTDSSVIGQSEYTISPSTINIDWGSFKISRTPVSVSSLTQTGGVATATTSAVHNFVTGDKVAISGANETGYNGFKSITVTSTTQFTFTVDSTLSTPATGTIVVYPPYSEKVLKVIDIDQYREQGLLADDGNSILTEDFSIPNYVVRMSDNNYILSPKPDRVYPISYNSFSFPVEMEDYDDTTSIPDMFVQCIVDKALHYVYMFRDNLEQAALANNRYEDLVDRMRQLLVPSPEYFRAE